MPQSMIGDSGVGALECDACGSRCHFSAVCLFSPVLSLCSAYIYGFDHTFVRVVGDFSNAASCPLLTTEGLSLAALVECAGGALDQTEYDFITQTRSNHREKKIAVTAPLSEWRQFDAFNGCNTPGMLQEAFDAYWGKMIKKAT